MTFTLASQTAHNVQVRKVQRTHFVAPASRRLSRRHLARAVYPCKPAICLSKSLFLKILPVSPMDSRFCQHKAHSFPRKPFINRILQALDQKIIFVIPTGAERRAQTAALHGRASWVSPVPHQSLLPPHLATALAERLFIISVPLRKKRTPWHSTTKSTNCAKRS